MGALATDERTALLAGEGPDDSDRSIKDDEPAAYGAGLVGLPWWKRPSVSFPLPLSFNIETPDMPLTGFNFPDPLGHSTSAPVYHRLWRRRCAEN